jgi:diguanylate cyclase (GGDEF)-like protein
MRGSTMNYIKKIPWKIWVIIIICYIAPFFIKDVLTIQGIRDMRWFLYLVPAFFFAYYYGLRTGIILSFLSNLFYLLWEWGETFVGVVRPEWESYLIFVISLINLSVSIGVGYQTDRVRLLSIIDPLSNLYSRRYINNYRLKENQATIFFIDLDRFKWINDSLGHHIGDLILQSVSDRLKEHARKHEMVARLGGDEFVFVLYEVDIDRIKKKAQEILQSLSSPYFIEGNQLYLTASIGISQCFESGQELDNMIVMADIAMFRAKQQGKNRYQFYTEEMNIETLERVELEKNLHKALEREEFLVYYQPRMDIKTNTMIGMEALIRWQQPYGKIISPEKFISTAEETGLIVPIGEWVLYTACKQNKEWQDAGFAPLLVSVNISALQFQHDLVATVNKILNQTGLDPKWLELEITESMLMKSVEEAVQILYQLKNLGIYLSIDDFGTGYSSLNFLKSFPIDCLKIDKSFVRDILLDVSISRAIITLGHSLGLEVIAEGIENQEQVLTLQLQGCNHGQGYFYSPPVPKQEFEEYFLVGNCFPSATQKS